jgi:outer membrane protein assembly factor BamB
VAGYWHGSRAVAPELGNKHPRLVWETEDALCGLMAQPLYRDGVAYLMDRRTGVNAFEFKTGKVLWKAANQYEPKDRNPQATMVWVGQTKRVLVLNSLGELILTEFSAQGHKEISRMQIIGKTWAHPAYSGDSVFARSDREIIRVRLPIVR